MPTPKKTATRKATAPKPKTTPLVDLASAPFDASKVTQVHLFSIGDTDYTIPSDCHAGVLSEYLDIAGTRGTGPAMWWLFGALAGADAVAALRGYDGLTTKHLNELHSACVDVITGPKA